MTDPTIPDGADAPFDIDVKVIDKLTGKELPMPSAGSLVGIVRPKREKKPATASELAIKEVHAITADFDKVAAGIAALSKKYANVVFPVATTKGMEEAKAARMEVRDARYRVQRALDAAKAPLNTLKADITSRAKEIIGQLTPLEDPIHEQIDAEEKRKEAEKAERERAERVAAGIIETMIDQIRTAPMSVLGQSSADIDAVYQYVNDCTVTLEKFGDRAGEAEQVKIRALEQLEMMAANALAIEVERDRMAAEAEALRQQREEAAELSRRIQAEEDQRREQAARALAEERKAIEAERTALAAERKAADDAKQAEARRIEDAAAAERRKLEDAERAKRLEDEEADRAERAKVEAARVEAARREQEAQQKTLMEAAEARRLVQERADAITRVAPALAGALQRLLVQITDPACGGHTLAAFRLGAAVAEAKELLNALEIDYAPQAAE